MNNIIGFVRYWTFTFREIASGGYQLDGWRKTGESISCQGSNFCQMAENVSPYAISINKKYSSENDNPYFWGLYDSKFPWKIPEEIQGILFEEILLGNYIWEYWNGWGNVIKLGKYFERNRKKVKPPLFYHDFQDPHFGGDGVYYEDIETFLLLAPFRPRNMLNNVLKPF